MVRNQLLDERVSTIFSTTEEADSYIVKEAHNLKVSLCEVWFLTGLQVPRGF